MCTGNILEHQAMPEYRSVRYNVHVKCSRMNKNKVLPSDTTLKYLSSNATCFVTTNHHQGLYYKNF